MGLLSVLLTNLWRSAALLYHIDLKAEVFRELVGELLICLHVISEINCHLQRPALTLLLELNLSPQRYNAFKIS